MPEHAKTYSLKTITHGSDNPLINHPKDSSPFPVIVDAWHQCKLCSLISQMQCPDYRHSILLASARQSVSQSALQHPSSFQPPAKTQLNFISRASKIAWGTLLVVLFVKRAWWEREWDSFWNFSWIEGSWNPSFLASPASNKKCGKEKKQQGCFLLHRLTWKAAN